MRNYLRCERRVATAAADLKRYRSELRALESSVVTIMRTANVRRVPFTVLAEEQATLGEAGYLSVRKTTQKQSITKPLLTAGIGSALADELNIPSADDTRVKAMTKRIVDKVLDSRSSKVVYVVNRGAKRQRDRTTETTDEAQPTRRRRARVTTESSTTSAPPPPAPA